MAQELLPVICEYNPRSGQTAIGALEISRQVLQPDARLTNSKTIINRYVSRVGAQKNLSNQDAAH